MATAGTASATGTVGAAGMRSVVVVVRVNARDGVGGWMRVLTERFVASFIPTSTVAASIKEMRSRELGS